MTLEKKICAFKLKYISKLLKKNLVRGLLNFSWKTHLLCEAYQKGNN